MLLVLMLLLVVCSADYDEEAWASVELQSGGPTTEQFDERYAQTGDDVWRERAISDRRRLHRAKYIPASVLNFTELGFRKARMHPEAWKLVLDFWNDSERVEHQEEWEAGDIHTNHWLTRPSISHIPEKLKEKLIPYVRDQIADWTGVAPETLEFTSMYGVRTYYNGSVLRMHPDRDDTLVLSTITLVEKSVVEPWSLDIYDHSGRLHQVFLEPGEIIFYESASCVHGRPHPLNGSSFSNFYTHFRPTGWVERIEKFREENGIVNPRDHAFEVSFAPPTSAPRPRDEL